MCALMEVSRLLTTMTTMSKSWRWEKRCLGLNDW
jgi:hypothetical protein